MRNVSARRSCWRPSQGNGRHQAVAAEFEGLRIAAPLDAVRHFAHVVQAVEGLRRPADQDRVPRAEHVAVAEDAQRARPENRVLAPARGSEPLDQGLGERLLRRARDPRLERGPAARALALG